MISLLVISSFRLTYQHHRGYPNKQFILFYLFMIFFFFLTPKNVNETETQTEGNELAVVGVALESNN